MAHVADPSRPAIDRRRFLARSAAGGAVAGAAWVTPSVLTLDRAGAVGTCPSSLTFPWSTGGGCTVHTASTNPLVGNVGGPTGVDIRITATSSTGFDATAQDNFRTRSGAGDSCGTGPCGSGTPWAPRGNQSSFYALTMGPGNPFTCSGTGSAGRYAEVTFGFFAPGTTTPINVQNLSFTLLDVDTNGTGYLDRVYVGINGAVMQSGAATTGAGNDFTFTLGGGNVVQAITGRAVFQGTGSATATSPSANVTLTSRAGLNISSVTVRFRDQLGNATGDINSAGTTLPSTIQWVGIGDLTFCKAP